MEFITVEQFKEQPKEVQKVFLDWWKPNVGDICTNDIIGGLVLITQEKQFNNGLVPLLTEGQLRRFIEDKTESKISISPSIEGKYWIGYDKYANNEDGDLRRLVYSDNALKGLWIVACIVAKEGLDG